MGDLNARVCGNKPNFVNMIRTFSEKLEANENGKRILDYCKNSNLIRTNTIIKHIVKVDTKG